MQSILTDTNVCNFASNKNIPFLKEKKAVSIAASRRWILNPIKTSIFVKRIIVVLLLSKLKQN